MSDEDDDDGCDLFDSDKEEDEDGDLDESTKPVSNCCFPGVGDLTSCMRDYNGSSQVPGMESCRKCLQKS